MDKCWERWYTAYNYGNIAPMYHEKSFHTSRKNLPAILIITVMKRRNHLYKKYKSSGNQTAHKNYKYTRNKVTSELRKAKQGFFNKMNNANSKSFWKLYKTITKQKTSIYILHNRENLQALVSKAPRFNCSKK